MQEPIPEFTGQNKEEVVVRKGLGVGKMNSSSAFNLKTERKIASLGRLDKTAM